MDKNDYIINRIENIRAKNNCNWMDILRLAMKHDPKNAKKILKSIFELDKAVCAEVEKMLYGETK